MCDHEATTTRGCHLGYTDTLIQRAVKLHSSLTSAVSLHIRCITNRLAMLTIEIYTLSLHDALPI